MTQMTPRVETLAAATAAVNALARVLGGDGKKDRGLMPKRTPDGHYHLRECNIGMWLYAGDSLKGGQPCSKRCVAAREALNLTATFTEMLVADLTAAGLMGDARPLHEQLRLLEAV